MALRSRRRIKTKNALRAWFKHFVPTSDPENPRTLPLPDEELFRYSALRRSERVAARNDHPISPLVTSSMDPAPGRSLLPDIETRVRQFRSMDEMPYQYQLVPQQFDNDVGNFYSNYQWNDAPQSASFNQYEYRQPSESSESDIDDDDEYIPQGSQRMISAARVYTVQRPQPTQSTASSSSQVSLSGVKKRKYRLKKDKEREDPEYREKRDKNNEAVERSREKKKREEREEKEKSEAMREIIKMFMRREGEDDSSSLANSLVGRQKSVFDEIFHETFSRPNRNRQHTALNHY